MISKTNPIESYSNIANRHYSKTAVITLLQQLQKANTSLSMLKRQIFYIAHVCKLSRLVAW